VSSPQERADSLVKLVRFAQQLDFSHAQAASGRVGHHKTQLRSAAKGGWEPPTKHDESYAHSSNMQGSNTQMRT
jgi:hypothetical protein